MSGKTSLAYFYIYLVVQLIYIYINVYLPVFFLNVLGVDKIELAFILIFSYSALLVRPFIAYYYDTHNDSKRKIAMVLSAFATILTFIAFLMSVRELILFGIFFGLNLGASAILRVSADKALIIKSNSDKAKAKSATIVQLGSVTGAIIPNILFFVLYSDNLYSLKFWNVFFLAGILVSIPMIAIVFLFKEALPETNVIEFNGSEKKKSKKNVALMCVVGFFVYSDRLYEYLIEPWIVNKYGEQAFALYSFALIFLIGINAIGIVLAGILSPKFDKKKLLIVFTALFGLVTMLLPFVSLTMFLVLTAINQIFAGFLLVNLISCIMEASDKKAFKYHIISIFVVLTQIIFVPLGIYLSTMISTEMIILLVGVLTTSSIIPLFFVNFQKESKAA